MYDIFGLRRMRAVADRLEGLKAPCDAELNLDSKGYTLKTDTLEDLATAAVFFRDAVNGEKKDTPHISIEVDTSKISKLVCEAQDCIDKAVADMHVVCAGTDSIFVCGLNGGMSTEKVASKFNDHFTDGGTPKKQMQKAVTIPIDKMGKFRNILMQKAMKDIDLNHPIFFGFSSTNSLTNSLTKCHIKYDGSVYNGFARRHPDDTPNEYIGKSLSFKRAFAKLVDAVSGMPSNLGWVALHDAKEFDKVDVSTPIGMFRADAAENIKKGDKLRSGYGGCVYPKKSETKVKSECTDKESDKKSDDITITMSREEAKELRKHLGKQDHICYDTFHSVGVKLGVVRP